MEKGMTYSGTGVNYEAMDSFTPETTAEVSENLDTQIQELKIDFALELFC